MFRLISLVSVASHPILQKPWVTILSAKTLKQPHMASMFPLEQRNLRNDCFIYVIHNNDVIMGTMASQITSLTIVYSTVYSVADQRKHQSSASLAFVWGIHRGPVNSPHQWPVTRKMFPFDDVIKNMKLHTSYHLAYECRFIPFLRINLSKQNTCNHTFHA